MSFRPERVCTGSSKNPTEYVREDIVQEMLKDLAEKCADAVIQVTNRNHGMFFTSEIREACRNATGESDDK